MKMLKQSGTTKTAPLRIWIGIFLLVTLQMSTTLRPIIGHSDQLFTSEKRFFLEHWGMNDTNFNRESHGYKESLSASPDQMEATEQKEEQSGKQQGTTEENPFLGE